MNILHSIAITQLPQVGQQRHTISCSEGQTTVPRNRLLATVSTRVTATIPATIEDKLKTEDGCSYLFQERAALSNTRKHTEKKSKRIKSNRKRNETKRKEAGFS